MSALRTHVPTGAGVACGTAATFAVLGTALALALGAGPAGASELRTIQTPSRFVDPAHVSFNGGAKSVLSANVLLPDGYDPSQRYPVLFLLHGVGDDYSDWAKPAKGDIAQTAKGFPGIIVMPEGARGFYTDAWNGGRRGDPGWESYDLKELVPLIERSFPIRAGRQWHAIAGLSMGGMGSVYLASQLPGYFGASAAFSGFVSHQRPETEAGLQAVGSVSYTDIFGPQDGFYATGHNPSKLTANLTHTRLYVTVGDGTDVANRSSPSAKAGGGVVEAGLRPESEDLVAAARASGVDVTYVPKSGVHDWPYWRDHLREAIAWGFFRPVDEAPSGWTFRTAVQHGRMWDLDYDFDAPPETLETFVHDGRSLRGTGSGAVTLRTDGGCSLHAALPFALTLPDAPCRMLRLGVSPRRVTYGRTTALRFTVTGSESGRPVVPVAGAVVHLGTQRARTDARGVARLRFRPAGPPGQRHPATWAAGWRNGRGGLAVVRAARGR